MPFADFADLRMYYQRAGEGDPVLFISGTGSDLRNQPNQFDSPLAKTCDLISFDQRGLGQTENPRGDFTMQQYADDAAHLLDHLGLDQVLVVGVSFGGMVAQELLLRHPTRVKAAVLACTSAGGAGGASFPLHELSELSALERVTTHLRVADLRHTDEWIAQNPDLWQKRIDMALANVRADRDEEGASKQLMARARHDTFARLGQIQRPVLLVGGEFDGVAPMSNVQAIAAQIDNAEVRFFTGGHMFLIQDKAAYPHIIQWLKSYSS